MTTPKEYSDTQYVQSYWGLKKDHIIGYQKGFKTE